MRFVSLGALVVAACSAAPDVAHDASDDAKPAMCSRAAPSLLASCVGGALAGEALEGTWTLSGTRVFIAGDRSKTEEPFNSPITLHRTGTGWCELHLEWGVIAPEGADLSTETYVDDTQVRAPNRHLQHASQSFWICVASATNQLTYHSETLLSPIAPSYGGSVTLDGVLTR